MFLRGHVTRKGHTRQGTQKNHTGDECVMFEGHKFF